MDYLQVKADRYLFPEFLTLHNIANATILCDDVLRIIFADSQIDSKQLFQIAKVCEQFRRIAQEIFAKKFNTKMIDLEAELSRHSWLSLVIHPQTFGPSITAIHIYSAFSNQNIVLFALVAKYCENLVQISYCNNSNTVSNRWRPDTYM